MRPVPDRVAWPTHSAQRVTAKLGARFGSIRSVKKLLGLVLAIVIVVSATLVLFPTKPTNAATVNGAKITRTSLNADLTAIAANSSFACYAALSYSKASGQTLLGINGATSRTFSTDFAAYWLSERIGGLAAEQYVAHHHLVVTAVDELTAAKDLAASITDVTNATSSATPVAECPANGAAVLASMPKSFVAQQVSVLKKLPLLLARTGSAFGTCPQPLSWGTIKTQV